MSSDNIAIDIDQASKCYHVYSAPVDRLKQFIVPRLSKWLGRGIINNYFREFWSLRDVSLRIHRGEVVGLVGVNGAGKSTLLQLICGVLQPTDGSIKVQGRVAALLELGAGFNPEFSGRENIFLNAALLGLTDEETLENLDDIIQFSGLSEFIDQPVKTYSSGMYVRLAFAIATSVHPDILIIDEALSVGDGAFARKSFDRILAMRDQGVTIIFCSHSLFQVEALCTRALWLDAGRVRELGPVAQVTASYQEYLDAISASAQQSAHDAPYAPQLALAPKGYARLRQLKISCDGTTGQNLQAISCQSDVSVDMTFDSDPSMPPPSAAVAISSADGKLIASCGSWLDDTVLLRDSQGRGSIQLKLEKIPLLKGRYNMSAYLFCERGLHIYTSAENVASLQVVQNTVEQGIFRIPRQWHADAGYLVAVQHANSANPSTNPLLPKLQLTSEWSERWDTRWATKHDLPALKQLFQDAFHHQMSSARWNWKYQAALAWGTAVEREGRIVGFYGGMPRACVLKHRTLQTVQIGDVMVSPDERHAGRSGPMMRSAASYIDNMPHLYAGFVFAFGFPSERHVRLGAALGLYQKVETIHEIAWAASPVRASIFNNVTLIPKQVFPAHKDAIEKLWDEMCQDFCDVVVPVRDYARWLYRYINHPEFNYQIILITKRFSKTPLAALVIIEHADHIELMDYLGGRSGIDIALNSARQWATRFGKTTVRGWFTSAIVPLFESGSTHVTATEIQVPINLRGRTKEQAVLPAPLWLMAGDSDFR